MNIKHAEFQELYVSENFDRLNNIENKTLEIEKSGFDQGAYDAIMRELHTMKGIGGAFGLPVVSDLCHQMEEIFVKGPNCDGRDISKKVNIILDFVDSMRSFLNAKLPSAINEERLRFFLFYLKKDSWTAQPFGSNGIRLRQSESLVIGKTVAIRPFSIENKILLEQLHQDLIDMRDNLSNEHLVMDLTNFEIVPLCMIGWAFALKEKLEKNNLRLIITGLKPDAVSLATRQRMFTRFVVKERLPDVILGLFCN
jgi:HPt (histidine-containing phosphotransfer) domain-containing protein